RRDHGIPVAVDGATDERDRRGDVRHALADDAVRVCVLQPSGRRISRRAARRHRLRAHGVVQRDLVALDRLQRVVGGHQSADRRAAGGAAASRGGLNEGVFMAAFRAVVIDKTDQGQKAQLRDFDEADLMDGDVTVRVEWSTLNYKDGLALTGKAPIARRWPMIAGVDLAGTVETSTDARWKPGDKVIVNGWGLGETHLGAYAEKARVKGDWLVPLPKGMSTREAMAIGTAGYTAMLSVLALEQHG